jgi:hypothetical protein
MAQGLQGAAEGLREAHLGQELLDVGHWGLEGLLGARALAPVCGVGGRPPPTAEDHARDAREVGEGGEIRLHSTPRQRLHANPNRKGLA